MTSRRLFLVGAIAALSACAIADNAVDRAAFEVGQLVIEEETALQWHGKFGAVPLVQPDNFQAGSHLQCVHRVPVAVTWNQDQQVDDVLKEIAKFLNKRFFV